MANWKIVSTSSLKLVLFRNNCVQNESLWKSFYCIKLTHERNFVDSRKKNLFYSWNFFSTKIIYNKTMTPPMKRLSWPY